MSIYTRVSGEEEPAIAWHQLKAAVSEVRRSKTTVGVVQTEFGLSTAEVTEITALVTKVNQAALTIEEIDDVMILLNRRKIYTTAAAVRTRLGVS